MSEVKSARSDPDMQRTAELFRAAAAAVLIGEAAGDGPPRDLLMRLDYLDGAVEQAPHRAAMLRAAAGRRKQRSAGRRTEWPSARSAATVQAVEEAEGLRRYGCSTSQRVRAAGGASARAWSAVSC